MKFAMLLSAVCLIGVSALAEQGFPVLTSVKRGVCGAAVRELALKGQSLKGYSAEACALTANVIGFSPKPGEVDYSFELTDLTRTLTCTVRSTSSVVIKFEAKGCLVHDQNVQPKSYSYVCTSTDSTDGQLYTMNLELSPMESKAEIVGELWASNRISGSIDYKYKARSPLVPKLRFGTDLIVDRSMIIGGTKLESGAFGGAARTEGVVEGGFYQMKYDCVRN